jgi:tRNA (cytidine/uridine-2'-O-)-methyltransferase
MFDLVLYQPEIPPNTGNLIRLCANTGARLHLVEPLGFDFEDKQLRRAGLDYREWASVAIHRDWAALRAALPGARWFAFSTKGTTRFDAVRYRPDDALVFGPETRGLPAEILGEFEPDRILRLPMRPEQRSLNLSNAAAVAVFEAWRQCGFEGAV